MARTKEFDQETALLGAIRVFSEHGFEGASIDALLVAMNISRQSMYDTFGDKWQLYLQALQNYISTRVGEQLRALNSAPSALAGLEAYVNQAAELAIADQSPTCMGVSAICEFGRFNTEVNLLTDLGGRALASSLERRIAEGQEQGDIAQELNARLAAGFIGATLFGIKVSARAGAQPDELRSIASMAIRSLLPGKEI